MDSRLEFNIKTVRKGLNYIVNAKCYINGDYIGREYCPFSTRTLFRDATFFYDRMPCRTEAEAKGLSASDEVVCQAGKYFPTFDTVRQLFDFHNEEKSRLEEEKNERHYPI